MAHKVEAFSAVTNAPSGAALGPPPRRVRWRMDPPNQRVLVWRLSLFPLIVIGSALLAFGPFRIWVCLAGQELDGEVTEIRHIQSRRHGNEHERVMMAYSYVAGGEVHFGSRQIEKSQEMDFTPPPGMQKARVKVKVASLLGIYWDEVPLESDGVFSPGCQGLGLCTAPGIMILFFTIGSYHRHFSPLKKLYRTGSVTSGRIVGKRAVQKKGSTSYRLDYEFEHPKLGVLKHFMDVSHYPWEEAREGEVVTVLYYPDRKQSVAYEYGDYVAR